MRQIYAAGIAWEHIERDLPLVSRTDVVPLAPLTILFGANDSGKSSTLRALADRLEGLLSRRSGADESTVIVSFRDDVDTLRAMLSELDAGDEIPSAAGRWVLLTLTDHPQLFRDASDGLADVLAHAPLFGLTIASEREDSAWTRDVWSVSLVDSPHHERDVSQPLREALTRLRQRWRYPDSVTLPSPDPRLFEQPFRPLHLGDIGHTALPLVPRPLRVPQGVNVALSALEQAVERARRAFRRWSADVGLSLPEERPGDPWFDNDGMPDPFVIRLVGDLEFLSSSLLPSFIRSTYELDFDPSSPIQEPGTTRLNARISAVMPLTRYETFARKFRVDEIASGFQLWLELAVWEMIAEVDSTTASLQLAASDKITGSLSRPGSPIARLEHTFNCWTEREFASSPTSLCSAEERAWQLDVLVGAPRDPRIADALCACARAVQPRLLLIDEPERHLNSAVVEDAARWLQNRANDARAQIAIATHSPAFLSCRGEEVRHVHVRRAASGLEYTTFTPSDQKVLATIASEMKLSHGELFGLVKTMIWVEGPMDRAVLDALCGRELQSRGAHVATFGGLGNIMSILDNPLTRLPNLGFLVLVDDLDESELDLVRNQPETVGPNDSDEMRRSADLARRAQASDRQLEIASHGAPDIFLALCDSALEELARNPWPGKDVVLRCAAEAGLPKSKLKGFVADRYRLRVDEANCRHAAELTRQNELPKWVERLLETIDNLAAA